MNRVIAQSADLFPPILVEGGVQRLEAVVVAAMHVLVARKELQVELANLLCHVAHGREVPMQRRQVAPM